MKILLVFAFLGLLLLVYVFLENKRLVTTNYLLAHKEIPIEFNDLKIMMLTDFHNNRFGKQNKRLLGAIRKGKPDLIVVTGDMVTIEGYHKKRDSARKLNRFKKNNESVIHLLSVLASEYPVYYALGNHETRWRDKNTEENEESAITFQGYYKQLQAQGVNFLTNQSVTLSKGNGKITITGLELPLDDYYKPKGNREKAVFVDVDYLNSLMGNSDKNAFQILLAHSPKFFKEYALWGASLIFSGHIHGGIARIPFIGGVISPQLEFFPKYDGGMFKEGKSIMLLSRGLGMHPLPVRFLNPPEIVSVILKPQE